MSKEDRKATEVMRAFDPVDSSPAERRTDERGPCPNRVRVLIRDELIEEQAVVYDATTTGLGIITTHSFPTGAKLLMQPQDEAKEVSAIAAEVRHVTTLQDGSYLIGCQLATPLPVGDVAKLLWNPVSEKQNPQPKG
jgi:hypothetical protein